MFHAADARTHIDHTISGYTECLAFPKGIILDERLLISNSLSIVSPMLQSMSLSGETTLHRGICFCNCDKTSLLAFAEESVEAKGKMRYVRSKDPTLQNAATERAEAGF